MQRLAVLLSLLGLAGGLEAQQVDLLSSASHVVLPQRRSFVLRARHQPIRIEAVRAKVGILGQAATTTLEITLKNPGRRQAEAVVLLPVPAGAAVSSFAFDGASSEPTAQLLRKDEARRIYDSIVAKVRDPALLEFAGHDVIRSSVFPVAPGGRQKIRVQYHHLCEASDGRIDYVLPRSESLDVAVPWRIEVEIKAKTPISTIYSPSHELKLDRKAPGHVVAATAATQREPGPFRLSYLREGKGIAASLFAYPDPKVGGGYFLLLAGLPPHGERDSVQREVTLVIDRSGSMAGPKLDQAKAAALQVVEGLADGEAFNIIDYATTVSSFRKAPVVKTRETLLAARAYLDSLRPLGGTNIHDALVEALRQAPVEGTLPIVLFLTDGLPTIGRTAEVTIRETVEKGNPHQRRVFTFGVGHDVNAPLLDRIAESTRAKPTYVQPSEDVELKVAQVFRRLYGPVFSGPRVESESIREAMPAALPDLFEGDQLVLLGQYRGAGPLKVKLAGSFLGKPRSFELEFDLAQATTRNAFVPRLWASRRIAFLVDAVRQAGGLRGARPAVVGESVLNDPKIRELVDAILRLSTEFGILSEYTSFLAREGTDLSDWDAMNARAGNELEGKVVKRRWGQEAVNRAETNDRRKNQKKVDYYGWYYDANRNRVENTGVQQVCDRSLFRRGKTWVDGRLVGGGKKPELAGVVDLGTPEYAKLVDTLVAEGRVGVIAFKGEILLQINGKTILVRNQ